mmetsp:Transcript_1611/g.5559  ORF Transcript_1611/g.5559 Transcript_1611/m.5559 type:complete len:266 (-) Transcript_1611:720-1517(-)
MQLQPVPVQLGQRAVQQGLPRLGAGPLGAAGAQSRDELGAGGADGDRHAARALERLGVQHALVLRRAQVQGHLVSRRRNGQASLGAGGGVAASRREVEQRVAQLRDGLAHAQQRVVARRARHSFKALHHPQHGQRRLCVRRRVRAVARRRRRVVHSLGRRRDQGLRQARAARVQHRALHQLAYAFLHVVGNVLHDANLLFQCLERVHSRLRHDGLAAHVRHLELEQAVVHRDLLSGGEHRVRHAHAGTVRERGRAAGVERVVHHE